MQVHKSLPAIQSLVTQLEKAGYEIGLQHRVYDEPVLTGTGLPAIGHTYCFIKKHKQSASGFAYCSTKDQFSRPRGTQVAFNRAINNLSAKIGRDEVQRLFATS